MRFLTFLLIPLVLTGCSLWQASSPQPPAAPQMQTQSGAVLNEQDARNMVAYYAKDGQDVQGYYVEGTGVAPRPALVLIHEWWGLNQNIRDLAHEFAAKGYNVLAVDMYAGDFADTREEAQTLSGAVREAPEEAMRNITAAVRFLETRPTTNPEKIGSVGWCFGGTWSYELAKTDLGVDAAVIYYGRFPADDTLSGLQTKVLGHFGDQDTSIPLDAVNQLQSKLAAISPDHQVYIYEGAAHAFANKGGANYLEEPARVAMERTTAFLDTYLK